MAPRIDEVSPHRVDQAISVISPPARPDTGSLVRAAPAAANATEEVAPAENLPGNPADTPVEEIRLPAGGAPEAGRADALRAGARPCCEVPGNYELRLTKQGPENLCPPVPPGGSTDFCAAAPDPGKEALKRRIAEKLIAANPQFHISQFHYDQIAQFERISVEEARRKYRQLELSTAQGGNDLQIILRDDDALITIPFWPEAQGAANAFQELPKYLEIICREANYVVYDPQNGRVFGPASGGHEVLASYHEFTREVREKLRLNGEPSTADQARAACAGTNKVAEERVLIRELEGLGADRGLLVAVGDKGAVEGFAEVCLRERLPSQAPATLAASLLSWFVAPEFRGRGIGRCLLEGAERWAAARGAKLLTSCLDAARSEAAQIHLKCGFRESHRDVHFVKLLSMRALSAER